MYVNWTKGPCTIVPYTNRFFSHTIVPRLLVTWTFVPCMLSSLHIRSQHDWSLHACFSHGSLCLSQVNLICYEVIDCILRKLKLTLKVPKCEILISWILMIFFIMKSLKVGDFSDEIKFLHFLPMGEIQAILFLLPHAPSTLANCYCMRSIC
jgi:hypothetical protein